MNKKIVVIIIFSFLFFSTYGQRQKVKNQPYGDQRLYHFGLLVGLNFQDMMITNSGYVGENGESWYCEIPNYSTGFSVGLISDLYLNPYMNLRFTPTLHFGDQKYAFIEEHTDETYTATIRSNFLNFPLDVKFSSMRLNNYRPYLIAGAYGAWNLGRKKDEAILLKPYDFGFSIGIGCDFYLPIVKICPEIRFNFGLVDMVEKDRPDLRDRNMLKYTQSIAKGTSRMIVLTFNFE